MVLSDVKEQYYIMLRAGQTTIKHRTHIFIYLSILEYAKAKVNLSKNASHI